MSEALQGHQDNRSGTDHPGWGARWWLEVAVGRNPMISRHHRQQARVIVVAVILVVAAAVISVGVGAVVYSARATHYHAEKASWTLVSARATELSAMPVDSHRSIHQVHACWPVLGQHQCDTIDTGRPVSEGQEMTIWTDRHGHYVRTPEPERRALIDAAIAASVAWCLSAALIVLICTLWHRALARAHSSITDAELARLLTAQTG